MSRIFVTGATGFIGRALVPALAEQGLRVRAAVRRPPPYSWPASIEVVEHGDLAEPVDWRPALDGVVKVIHLAGIAHTGGIAPERYDAVNRRATELLAAAAAERDVEQFVFISTIRAQSGACADHVLSEHDRPRPTDAYGRSKLAAEEAVRRAGIPFTILRPAVLYGPSSKGNVALLMRLARLPLPLPLCRCNNRRSFLGIDNFVSAVQFVLSAPAAIGETYVVADPGFPPRLADIVAALRLAQGRRPLLWPMPPASIELPLRMIGCAGLWERLGGDLQVDAGKLIAAGWRPEHDTVAGLTLLASDAKNSQRL
jgi:nucleoside-diphosphate-sugar epimerase